MEPRLSSLIQAAERGDQSAADALFSALYSELHRVAKRELSRQGVPVSLGASTLLHQAYIEMAAKDGNSFPDRSRFMGYASRVMRGLIIDHARNRSALKRGGQFHITSSGTEVEERADDRELVRIGEALDELAKAEPALADSCSIAEDSLCPIRNEYFHSGTIIFASCSGINDGRVRL